MFKADYLELDTKIRLAFSFDFGFKKIGIAKGLTQLHTIAPVKVAKCKKNKVDWQTLDSLIKTWKPDFFVVGTPVLDDVKDSQITLAIRGFVKKLFGKYGKTCFLVDESFSSLEAKSYVQDAFLKTEQGYVDAYAACVILERFFNSETNIVNIFDCRGWRINEQTA